MHNITTPKQAKGIKNEEFRTPYKTPSRLLEIKCRLTGIKTAQQKHKEQLDTPKTKQKEIITTTNQKYYTSKAYTPPSALKRIQQRLKQAKANTTIARRKFIASPWRKKTRIENKYNANTFSSCAFLNPDDNNKNIICESYNNDESFIDSNEQYSSLNKPATVTSHLTKNIILNNANMNETPLKNMSIDNNAKFMSTIQKAKFDREKRRERLALSTKHKNEKLSNVVTTNASDISVNISTYDLLSPLKMMTIIDHHIDNNNNYDYENDKENMNNLSYSSPDATIGRYHDFIQDKKSPLTPVYRSTRIRSNEKSAKINSSPSSSLPSPLKIILS